MGKPKDPAPVVGTFATIRKTGMRVKVLEFRGSQKADRILVEMPNKRAQWVRRRDIRWR
jgi:hypothetical protein